VGEVWLTTHITELCLQLTAGSGPGKQRSAPTLGSQTCERAVLTMGTFTLPFPYCSVVVFVVCIFLLPELKLLTDLQICFLTNH